MIRSTAVTVAATRVEGDIDSAALRAIEPAALFAAGYGAIILDQPVDLERTVAGEEEGEREVRLVHLLREAISYAFRVDWTASTAPHTEPLLLCHLQPPAGAAPAAARATREWRERFGYGRCYYRKGPGFVTIRDTRDPAAAARFRVDDPAAVAAFDQLEDVVHLPTAPPRTQELFELIAAERLAVRRGAWGTLLPARMRVWPVPYNAI